jgi:hypothetical protein
MTLRYHRAIAFWLSTLYAFFNEIQIMEMREIHLRFQYECHIPLLMMMHSVFYDQNHRDLGVFQSSYSQEFKELEKQKSDFFGVPHQVEHSAL